jgi:hypothetical protein
VSYFVTKIPTANGTRYFVTDGRKRKAGGFARLESAKVKAELLNEIEREGSLPVASSDGLLRTDKQLPSLERSKQTWHLAAN